MEIITKISKQTIKIAVIGELDANSAISLDRVIRKAIQDEFYKIIIDCEELNYISSAGLGVFISYIEEMKTHHGQFVFIKMKDRVYNVFKILGLEKLITILPSFEEAKKALHEN